METSFNIKMPVETSRELALKTRRLRLEKRWTRRTLSKRSGVPESTLRRFEDTGKISLESFLKLMNALGRLHETNDLLTPEPAVSMEDLKRQAQKNHLPQRGSV